MCSSFDRTYEGLKLLTVRHTRGQGLEAFDRTYEGLKPEVPGQGGGDEGNLLTVPMRV